MAADRFTVAAVFAIDIACLVTADLAQQQLLQSRRATSELGQALRACLAEGGGFGAWVDERARIDDRMRQADRDGGVKVWSNRFLESHAPLVRKNQNDPLLVDGRDVHEDGRLDPNERRYRRRGYFRQARYRITPEGALTATFQADFLDEGGYVVSEVIRMLSNFRGDAFGSFRHFLRDFFGNPHHRRLLHQRTGLVFDRIDTLSADELDTFSRRHQLIFIRGFWDRRVAGGEPQRARLRDVLESGELAGILTEAPWYEAYGARFIRKIHEKEIGHRGDEIYLVGNHSTVVVAERYWHNLYAEPAVDATGGHLRPTSERDPLYWYQADLLTMIEHQLSRLALLRQQLAFFRDHGMRRPLEAQRPADALPLVLDGRANLTQVSESLDFTSLVRHGFMREFAALLRREMGLDEQLDAVRRRILDMSEAVNLKSSVTSAKANTSIQTAALLIAVIALAVSVLALFISRG